LTDPQLSEDTGYGSREPTKPLDRNEYVLGI